LPTRAYFSSNWTARVCGGKSHEFIVESVGVLAGDHGQADHRSFVDPDQATGLAHPATFLRMVEHGHGLGVGQFAAVQGGALAFREALLAGPASQDTGGLGGVVGEANAKIVEAAPAVV